MCSPFRMLSYPHCRMQTSRNLIVRLKPWTTPKDLRQPKLIDCSFHVSNLALSRWGSSNPLRRFSTYTADHISVGQSLGCTVAGPHRQWWWKWLSYSWVKWGRPAGNDEVRVNMISSWWSTIICPRPQCQRRCHCNVKGFPLDEEEAAEVEEEAQWKLNRKRKSTRTWRMQGSRSCKGWDCKTIYWRRTKAFQSQNLIYFEKRDSAQRRGLIEWRDRITKERII